jgi:lipopolysaccharide/colanic/teichoic acid biosynthesis glycosyltransferase
MRDTSPIPVLNTGHAASASRASAEATALPLWKRALDTAVILMALPIVAPLWIVIGILIKCVSRGPVLFRQERIGLLGRPFTCLKFRTMQVNAITTGHQGYLQTLMNSNEPMTKMDLMGDARLIRGGSILRATGLDELPQLINVLRGEMSIVGPRPCVAYEYENYLPWQKRRFNCVPGLTGLWQVSGKNKTTFNQMIEMDIKYAQKKSLGFDLWIMARTGPAIIRQSVEMIAKRARSAKVTGSTAKG